MKTFFFFGDSITLGVNDPELLGWVGRVCKYSQLPIPPTTFYNLGARRHSSVSITARWKSETEARKLPGTVCRLLFSFGVVDALMPEKEQLVPLQESLANLRALIHDLRQNYTSQDILFVSPVPSLDRAHNERIDQLTALYQEICSEEQIAFINMYVKLRYNEQYLADLGDGIHPGAKGYQIIADFLLAQKKFQAWLQH